jgi:hypothetical protein
MAGIGPAPKPASKRRRANKPRSYGLAQPTVAQAACVQPRELGLEDPHPLIAQLWTTVQSSCEAAFFSEADWARLRCELWFANETMRKPTGGAWQQVQRGLNELLISPAAKRRAAVELKAAGPDENENVAVAMIGRYRQSLKSV